LCGADAPSYAIAKLKKLAQLRWQPCFVGLGVQVGWFGLEIEALVLAVLVSGLLKGLQRIVSEGVKIFWF
jgi:hypothetical protein